MEIKNNINLTEKKKKYLQSNVGALKTAFGQVVLHKLVGYLKKENSWFGFDLIWSEFEWNEIDGIKYTVGV